MFRAKYGHVVCKNVINIDETGVWYDSIPHTIIAFSGKATTVADIKWHGDR
jgi:hypothetical protein